MTQSARILLVSDSPDEREMYGHALRLGGYCTLQAPPGSTALRMAEELQPSAVVISEGRSVDEPGAIRLRSVLHASPAAPAVVILANYLGSGGAGRKTDGDGARVLLKPCVPEDLVRTVDELLASMHQPSRSQPLKRA
jgi:DNA-binding NtrC family response regulator